MSASKSNRSPAFERLRARLGDAGATEDEIDIALEESGKRERIRNRALRSKLKALTAQINELNAQGGASGGASGGSDIQAGGGADRLWEARDQIVEASAALKLAGERIGAQTNGRALSDVADALAALHRSTRQVVWLVCIGMGIIAPSVVILLVSSVWGSAGG